MTQATVVEWKKTDSGIIQHQLSDGSMKEYAAIRAGLSLPTEEANGYFVILGEIFMSATWFEGQERKRGKVQLLAEQEIQSAFLDDTLRPFTDECALLGCQAAYTGFSDTPDIDEIDQQVRLAREQLQDQRSGVTLYSAPYFAKFKTGVDIIRSFIDKALLILPENSIAAQQLGSLSQYDLAEKPESRFVAVNGLRFVMGSFHKSPPNIGQNWVPRRQRRAFNLSRPRF